MPLTSAMGVHVRHAVSRALATANLSIEEATWRVESARVWLTSGRRVARGEVTLLIRKPRPLISSEPHELEGWVNPDGDHPEMVLVRLDDPLFVDCWPVSWSRWVGPEGRVPDSEDASEPRLGLRHQEAAEWAAAHGRRLPTLAEFRALWGAERLPWGQHADPGAGRVGPVRYGERHEIGLYPPVRGLYDLGAWLWHWLDDATVAGAVAEQDPVFGIRPAPGLGPIGFRTVADPRTR